VGSQLSKDDIGKIIRAMPYGNSDDAFSDMTADYDNATNDILALDRGEWRPPHNSDNHIYLLKKFTSRLKQADFLDLPREVQEMYLTRIDMHEKMEAENQRKLLAAKSEYIPTDGYMVTVDLYVSDPKDPNKTRRARIPYSAVLWLIKQIEAQGASLDQLEQLNASNQIGISENLGSQANQSVAPDMDKGPNLPLEAIGNPSPSVGQGQPNVR
jgi:hypothetical protein